MTNTTAEKFWEMAKQAEQDALDSFERCDTDGFLSQWASGISAEKYRAQARLAENNGKITYEVLFYEGKLASTHEKKGQYGWFWVLNDEATAAYGKRFFSGSQAKNAAERDRAKGFTYGAVEVDGYVTTMSNGYGLSGNVWVATLPVVQKLIDGDFVVLSKDVNLEEPND